MTINATKKAAVLIAFLIVFNLFFSITILFFFQNLINYFHLGIVLMLTLILGVFLILIKNQLNIIEFNNSIKNKDNKFTKKLDSNSNRISRIESKLLKIQTPQPCDPYYQTDEEYNTKIKPTIPDAPENYQLNLGVEDDLQQSIGLPVQQETDLITWPILLRALHFPSSLDDKEGFQALEIARKSAIVSELLQASEDLLNLLAQDGLYLDDLIIEQPPVEAWCNFTKTNRSELSKKLDCIGLETETEKLKLRLRKDTVFRDTTLMLIRRFDQMLKDRIHLASDDQIFNLAYTRTGKAFLIAGKICDSL